MALNLKTETSFLDDRPPAPPPLPPEQIAPHFPQLEVLECLGRGGMGVVYKARQKSLNRLVALKLLAPERAEDPQFAARFEKEARALAALNHPNIVTIYDHGRAGGFYYLLMEFVDGVTLRQLLAKERVAPREALAIVPQICDALQFAHDQGIVHRDIKPENILLDRRGRVKVADFGLAKIVANGTPLTPSLSPSDGEMVAKPGEGSPVITDAGKIMGTPQYMSPEQITAPGEVDHRADIYALGVVFYQMLTGELPGKRLEAPSKKVSIDVRLDEVVLRALEKKPELRYQQASALKTQVETIASTPDSGRRRGGDSQTEQPESQSRLTSAATNPESRFSRTAIVGACWTALAVLWGIAFFGMKLLPGFGLKSFFSLLPFGVTAPFVTTILGWIAVSQIRRSAGKLYGLWLAVFDGLFFPLLALDFGIAWFLHQLGIACGWWTQNYDARGNAISIVSSVVAWIVVDWLIIRRVWRAVNRPTGDARVDSRTQPSEPPLRRPLPFAAAAWTALIVWVLVTLGATVVTFLMPESYQGVARIKVQRDEEHLGPGGVPRPYYDPYFIQTEFEVLQSQLVLGRVIKELDLNTLWGRKYKGGQRLRDAESQQILRSCLELRPVRNTSLIEIRVFSDRPDEAARIANAIAEAYQGFRVEQRAKLDLQANPPLNTPPSAGVRPTPVEIIDRAVPTLRPVRPNKPLNIAIGAMGGAVTGVLAGGLVLLVGALRRLWTPVAPVAAKPSRFWGRFAIVAAVMLLALMFVAVATTLLWIATRPSTHGQTQFPVMPTSSQSPPATAIEAHDQAPTFGPVIERALCESGQNSGQELLDLDTGRVFGRPTGFGKLPEAEQLQWLAETGVDLSTGHTGLNDRELVLPMFRPPTLVRMSNDSWTSLSAATVNAMAELQGTESAGDRLAASYGEEKLGQPPVTFAFRTANSTRGLMQVTGFTENPRGVKLRFKLVPKAMTAAAGPEASRGGKPDYAQAAATMGAMGEFEETLGPALEKGDQAAALKTSGLFLEQLRLLNAQVRGTELELPASSVSLLTQMQEAIQAGDMKLGRSLYDAAVNASSAFEETLPGGDYKARLLKLAAQQRDVTRPHPATNSSSFGPVIERVVHDGSDGFGKDMYLDLDTSRLMSYPRDQHFSDPNLGRQWMATNGLDVQAINQVRAWTNGMAEAADKVFFEQSGQHLPAGPLRGIFIADATTLRLDGSQWDSLTPDALTTALARQPSNAIRYYPAASELPVTVGFKTREGSMGIMQITGFTENPRGVKLRYKLVQTGFSKPRPVTPAGPKVSFGPVMELEVGGTLKVGTNCFVDFDTGRVLTPPDDVLQAFKLSNWSQSAKTLGWLKREGVDMIRMGSLPGEMHWFQNCHTGGGSHPDFDLNGQLSPELETQLVEFKANVARYWENPSAVETSPAEPFRVPVPESSRPGLNSYVFFMTDQQRLGIMQVVRTNSRPRGVKIRYKLVQAAAAASNPAPASAQELASRLEAAIIAGDTNAVKNLVNWRGVSAAMKPQLLASLARVLEHSGGPLRASVTLRPLPADFDTEGVMNGIRYRPNVTLLGMVSMSLSGVVGGSSVSHSAMFPYGQAGQEFYLAGTTEERLYTPKSPEKMFEIRVAGLFATNGTVTVPRSNGPPLVVPYHTEQKHDAPPFVGWFVYVQNGKEVRKDFAGHGSLRKLFWGDSLTACTVRKTTATNGSLQLVINREYEILFASEPVTTQEPIQYRQPPEQARSAPKAGGPGAAAMAFGPVMERVVKDGADANGKAMLFDLDTGEVKSETTDPAVVSDQALMQAKLAEEGVDLAAVHQREAWTKSEAEAFDDFFFKQSGQHLPASPLKGIIGYHLSTLALEAEEWDRITPGALSTAMNKVKGPIGQPLHFYSAAEGLPMTLGFRTREGGMGVLQITGLSDSPRGVKIRYKLVQKPPTKAAPTITAQGGRVVIESEGTTLIADNIQITTGGNLTANNPKVTIRGTSAPPAAIEDALRKQESLQFRWVAAEGDTNSPADMLPDASDASGQRVLRVLRTVVLSEMDVDRAGFSQYQGDSKEVAVFLSPRGGEKFATATAENIGRQLAIVWSGRVISAPVVRAAITSRSVTISGRFSGEEAQTLLDVLNHRSPATNAPAR